MSLWIASRGSDVHFLTSATGVSFMIAGRLPAVWKASLWWICTMDYLAISANRISKQVSL